MKYHKPSIQFQAAELAKPVPCTNCHRQFIADAVENVLDSVVNITLEITQDSGLFTKKKVYSSGSGFVVHEDGIFVTNAHVVSEISDEGEVFIIKLYKFI